MKQTAVEFYRINLMALVSTGKTDFKTEPEIFEQAKEMEKQQMFEYIKNNYCIGHRSLEFHRLEFEQYYNETFKK